MILVAVVCLWVGFMAGILLAEHWGRTDKGSK